MRNMALALFLSCAAPAAFAHSGVHPLDGFLAGFSHPFAGLDHLLAMLAVGFWAADAGPRPHWRWPLAFLAIMAAGAGLGVAGLPLTGLEPGLAGSVLLLGLLIAARTRLSGVATWVLTGGFAMLHGHAHGMELAASPDFRIVGLGFMGATALLLACGAVLGLAARQLPLLYRSVGASIGVAGAFLLTQAL